MLVKTNIVLHICLFTWLGSSRQLPVPEGLYSKVLATVGHSLMSTPTNRLDHSWWSPIQVLTQADVVCNFSERATELAFVAMHLKPKQPLRSGETLLYICPRSDWKNGAELRFEHSNSVVSYAACERTQRFRMTVAWLAVTAQCVKPP
jgi:hypothetical protein